MKFEFCLITYRLNADEKNQFRYLKEKCTLIYMIFCSCL